VDGVFLIKTREEARFRRCAAATIAIFIGQRRVVGLSFGSPLAAGAAAGVLSVLRLLLLPSRLRDVVVLLIKIKLKLLAVVIESRAVCVRTRVHVLVQQTPPVLQHPRGDCIKDEGYGARTWNKNNKNIKPAGPTRSTRNT
jgi:hypothetical protein